MNYCKWQLEFVTLNVGDYMKKDNELNWRILKQILQMKGFDNLIRIQIL